MSCGSLSPAGVVDGHSYPVAQAGLLPERPLPTQQFWLNSSTNPTAAVPHKLPAALLTLDPATIGMLTSAAMLAPDGRCKTLDASADG